MRLNIHGRIYTLDTGRENKTEKQQHGGRAKS
jgi:hypothetical protein